MAKILRNLCRTLSIFPHFSDIPPCILALPVFLMGISQDLMLTRTGYNLTKHFDDDNKLCSTVWHGWISVKQGQTLLRCRLVKAVLETIKCNAKYVNTPIKLSNCKTVHWYPGRAYELTERGRIYAVLWFGLSVVANKVVCDSGKYRQVRRRLVTMHDCLLWNSIKLLLVSLIVMLKL